MTATEQASWPAPRLEQGNEEAASTVSAPAMAGIRLRGALDAAMRDGLTAGDLLALAGRIVSDGATEADAALLAALDVDDLAAVGMGAGTFVVSFAAVFRTVAAVMRSTPTGTIEPIKRAALMVSGVTAALRERLQVLPDADELLCIGARFECGGMTPADIAVIRALPGPYLRASASARHYAAIFVDYRLWDY